MMCFVVFCYVFIVCGSRSIISVREERASFSAIVYM